MHPKTADLVLQPHLEPQTVLTQKPKASSSPLFFSALLDLKCLFAPPPSISPFSVPPWILPTPNPQLLPIPQSVNEGQPLGHLQEQGRWNSSCREVQPQEPILGDPWATPGEGKQPAQEGNNSGP